MVPATYTGGDIYINGEKQTEIVNSMPGGGGAPGGGGPKAVDLEAGIHNNKQRQDFFLTFLLPFYDRIEIQSAYRKEHDEKQTLPLSSHSCCLFFSISLCAGP